MSNNSSVSFLGDNIVESVCLFKFIFLLLCFFLLIQIEFHLMFCYSDTPLPCDLATFLLSQLWLFQTVLCHWQALSPEHSPIFCVNPEYCEHSTSLRGQLAAFTGCESWSCIYTKCLQVPEWLDIYLINHVKGLSNFPSSVS